MITAKRNHPYTEEVDKRFETSPTHLFKPTLQCLKNQSTHNFELVVVDALYESRSNYYKKLEYPFTIKHVEIRIFRMDRFQVEIHVVYHSIGYPPRDPWIVTCHNSWGSGKANSRDV